MYSYVYRAGIDVTHNNSRSRFCGQKWSPHNSRSTWSCENTTIDNKCGVFVCYDHKKRMEEIYRSPLFCAFKRQCPPPQPDAYGVPPARGTESPMVIDKLFELMNIAEGLPASVFSILLQGQSISSPTPSPTPLPTIRVTPRKYHDDEECSICKEKFDNQQHQEYVCPHSPCKYKMCTSCRDVIKADSNVSNRRCPVCKKAI